MHAYMPCMHTCHACINEIIILHVGVILGSRWGHSGIMTELICDHSGVMLGHFGVKAVNLEFVDRCHARVLCIRDAFFNPGKVARLQESRSSAMSRLPRRRARPCAPGKPHLRTKARKQSAVAPSFQQRNREGPTIDVYIYIYTIDGPCGAAQNC